MGNKEIADIRLDEAEEKSTWDYSVDWRIKKYKITDDGIEFSWGDNLRLTGSYMLWLDISKNEVLRLFKRIFGRKFTREDLETLGLTVTGVTPTEEELATAIKNMKVSQLLSIIGEVSEHSARSDKFQVESKPGPRLVSSS